MDPRDRVAELKAILNRAAELYYQYEAPELSDTEYDLLFRELVDLETAHPELVSADSPTQRVGAQPVDGFESYRHQVPMLSLDNAFSHAELRGFNERIQRALESESVLEYLVELKYDGLSLSLTYDHGALVRAVTRGDGTTGENVTHNAKTIRDIPLTLTRPWTGEIRGEVLMFKNVFEKLNTSRIQRGLTPFANPRNAASGGMRQLDDRSTAERRLRFFAYGFGAAEGDLPERQSDLLEFIHELGFARRPLFWLCNGIEQVIDRTETVLEMRPGLEFGIDGCVVKVNSLELQNELGNTSRGPRWATAFKFPSEQAFTILEEIGVQVGRTGTITPVAHLAPVYVGGVTVTRATLHNYEELERKDVRVGDTVIVQRAGDVIPEIVGAVLEKRPADAEVPAAPKVCPVCESELEQIEGYTAIRCPNRRGCPAQIASKIAHFVSRRAMDIEGLGEKQIVRFLAEPSRDPLLTDVPSIYQLKDRRNDLLALERMGETSTENLLAAIEASKSPPLARFIYALGIPLVGERTAADLAREFRTLDGIRSASAEEFDNVPDIGPRTAEEIHDWFRDPENGQLIDALVESSGVTPVEGALPSGQIFEGKIFVFTGKLERFTREQAEEWVMNQGGRAAGSVSKNTSFVVAGPGAGTKLAKAEQLGVPVMDEEEFLRMLPNLAE